MVMRPGQKLMMSMFAYPNVIYRYRYVELGVTLEGGDDDVCIRSKSGSNNM